MAYFTVRNSLNPSRVAVLGITYRQLVDKNSYDGELIWVLEVATDEVDVNGDPIPPVFVHLTSESSLDAEISNAVAAISEKIDWEPLAEDGRAPYVDSQYPASTTASIWDNVWVNIKEIFPSAGIDPDSIQMFVNGTEVTDDLEITGDTYDYKVTWSPPGRLFKTEV